MKREKNIYLLKLNDRKYWQVRVVNKTFGVHAVRAFSHKKGVAKALAAAVVFRDEALKLIPKTYKGLWEVEDGYRASLPKKIKGYLFTKSFNFKKYGGKEKALLAAQEFTLGKNLYPKPKHVHGTELMYHRKCRCDKCKAAHTKYILEDREQRHKRLRDGTAPKLPHGVTSTYINWGCRCEPCVKAQKKKCVEWRKAHRRISHEKKNKGNTQNHKRYVTPSPAA